MNRRRRLSQQALRDLGATPSLMARCVLPDGWARLEQLAPEGPERRQQFARRHTNAKNASEGPPA